MTSTNGNGIYVAGDITANGYGIRVVSSINAIRNSGIYVNNIIAENSHGI